MNWYHHIVLTHSFKLVSFPRLVRYYHIVITQTFTSVVQRIISCTSESGSFPYKSWGMNLTHVKCAIRIRIFAFYLFKATQYTSGRVQNVGCVYYCCCSYYTAARYTWKSTLAAVDFDWRHLIAKLLTRTSVKCKDLSDICCTSRNIVHFVLKYVAIATRIGRWKCNWQHSMAHPCKPPYRRKNLLHKPSYSQFCPEFRCHGNGGQPGVNINVTVNKTDPENHILEPKITTLSCTQRKLWQFKFFKFSP